MSRNLKSIVSQKTVTYIYLANEQIGERFLREAEREGFVFGDGAKPTTRHWSEIMRINNDNTISYIGTMGRIAFKSGIGKIGEKRVLKVDYDKYINNTDNYIIDKENN